MKNNLADKAILVTVKISSWAGRKLDKQATAKVSSDFQAKKEAGNYTKKLLPNCKELQKVQNIAGKIRQAFLENTLPWQNDGTRILSSKNYLEFTQKFRDMKDEYFQSVNEFLNVYDTLSHTAALDLGSLYNAADYPTKNQLRESFDCSIGVSPMPSLADFRVTLSDDDLKSFEANFKASEKAAMNEVWNRLSEVIEAAVIRLKDPEAILKESLITNISDLCDMLPKLNVTDDQDLENKRQAISATISGLCAKDLRENKDDRQDAAQKLKDISDSMVAFMGKA